LTFCHSWGQIGKSNCINQTDAKYWARRASNMGSNTNISETRIFENTASGTVTFDNLEIATIP
jgi:hypothetical protein